MFRTSLCLSLGEQDCVLPHTVFCTVTREKKSDKFSYVTFALAGKLKYLGIDTNNQFFMREKLGAF